MLMVTMMINQHNKSSYRYCCGLYLPTTSRKNRLGDYCN